MFTRPYQAWQGFGSITLTGSDAQILLLADEHRPDGRYKDKAIADIVGVGTATVETMKVFNFSQ